MHVFLGFNLLHHARTRHSLKIVIYLFNHLGHSSIIQSNLPSVNAVIGTQTAHGANTNRAINSITTVVTNQSLQQPLEM